MTPSYFFFSTLRSDKNIRKMPFFYDIFIFSINYWIFKLEKYFNTKNLSKVNIFIFFQHNLVTYQVKKNQRKLKMFINSDISSPLERFSKLMRKFFLSITAVEGIRFKIGLKSFTIFSNWQRKVRKSHFHS